MSLALLGMLPVDHRDFVREGENPRMPEPTKTHRILPAILERARDFRHPLTPPEAKVWRAVRNRQLGFKMRRQGTIGRFIVDFYCAEARLAIEIDGEAVAPAAALGGWPRPDGCTDLARLRIADQGGHGERDARALDLAGVFPERLRQMVQRLGYEPSVVEEGFFGPAGPGVIEIVQPDPDPDRALLQAGRDGSEARRHLIRIRRRELIAVCTIF